MQPFSSCEMGLTQEPQKTPMKQRAFSLKASGASKSLFVEEALE